MNFIVSSQLSEIEFNFLINETDLFIKKNNKNYDYYFFQIKKLITISIFNSKKILFQGESEVIRKFIQDNNLKQANKDFLTIKEKYYKSIPAKNINENILQTINYYGCDESGVSDFFGPIVFVAFIWNQPENKIIFEEFLEKENIIDSKKLDFLKINNLAPKLMKMGTYQSFILDNKLFNKLFKNKMNIKELMVYCHSQNLHNFRAFETSLPKIIDGFLSYKRYLFYVNKNNFYHDKNVKLIPKADSLYLAVTAASIIARYLFLKEITKMSNELKIQIPLGNDKKVKELIKLLKSKYNSEKLKEFIKWEYKTN